MTSSSYSSTALTDRLKEFTSNSQKSRLYKLLHNPSGLLGSTYSQKTGTTRFVNAKTFFNRIMRVVPPEPISVRVWRYGIFESDVAFYLISCLRESDTFIDIGGHFGFFSMLGRELVGANGTVITFEPMPSTREILTHNLEKNAGPAKQHIIAAAAGEKTGKLNFQDFGLKGSAFATSGTARNENYNAVGTVDVNVFTVDNVVDELGLLDCKVMKIDAENAELAVVKGAVNMITTLKPHIILETGDDNDGQHLSKPVIELLFSLGYKAYEFNNWALRQHNLSETYGYQNLLLVHNSRVSDVHGI